MPSCNTCNHLTCVSLTLDMGYLFTAAPASGAAAPYLGQVVSSHSLPSWPWTWSSSPSSRGYLISLHFLLLGWSHLHIWGYWHFSRQSWFQLLLHPGWHLAWCTLHRCYISKVTSSPIWNQSIVPCLILTVPSWPAYRFLRRKVRWSGIPISYFPQFVVIHTKPLV